jgi:hypothetical protein
MFHFIFHLIFHAPGPSAISTLSWLSPSARPPLLVIPPFGLLDFRFSAFGLSAFGLLDFGLLNFGLLGTLRNLDFGLSGTLAPQHLQLLAPVFTYFSIYSSVFIQVCIYTNSIDRTVVSMFDNNNNVHDKHVLNNNNKPACEQPESHHSGIARIRKKHDKPKILTLNPKP